MISPVDDPVSIMNACPNLERYNQCVGMLWMWMYELLSAISYGDDPFTLPVPLQVITEEMSVSFRQVHRKLTFFPR